MPRQLPLDLALPAAMGRGDFLVSPANAVALAQVDGWRDWPGGRILLLGPDGSGKTHLARLWAAETGAAVIQAAGLGADAVPGLLAAGAVAVEDCAAVAGDAAAEAALFHLLNLAAADGARILLTATRPVTVWGLALPDLQSRLQATPVAQLDPPDDALLAGVLVKLFADRQLLVPPALIGWIVPRMDRSLAEAGRIVAALDARALETGRPVGRALAAEILGEAEAGEPD